MIQSEHLSKQIQRKEILTDVTTTIPKGKLTAFVGPNGAGKSTFLATISRLTDYDSGEIYLEEEMIQRVRPKQLAKRLAFLKQSNHIALHITIEELVGFGRYPYTRGRLTKEDQRIIDWAMEKMTLTAIKQRSIHTLSGGQLQRVYIAMILAQDTDYILLDEPLNNLDMKHANQLMHVLKELVEVDQKTIIIVLHDINFAASFADYVIAMKEGKIMAEGETSKVITSTCLSDLYDLPVTVHELEGQLICTYFK